MELTTVIYFSDVCELQAVCRNRKVYKGDQECWSKNTRHSVAHAHR